MTEYLALEMHYLESARATIYVWNSGFLNEPFSVPHALEHMLIERTTPSMRGEDFLLLADRRGSKNNAEVYSMFSKYYSISPPDSVLSTLPSLLDMVTNALLDSAEFDIEKGTIRDEIRRTESDPELFIPLLAKGLLFAVNPFLLCEQGPIEYVNRISVDDIARFRNEFYTPSNMTLFVYGSPQYAGSFDERASRFHSETVGIF